MFQLQRLRRVLWLRATLLGLMAVAAALLAHQLAWLAPPALVEVVSDDAAEEILKVMASSMLAVATFSLATMVAAAGGITSNASPRAAALLLDDKSAQNAISVFIGAFIFSIVGLIALGTTFYSPAGRFILFVETLAVLAYVVLRLLRWVDQLSKIGRVAEAIDHVEQVTRDALRKRKSFLGGAPAREPPADAVPLTSGTVGYVQHVDVQRLDRLANRHGLAVHLRVLPGAFVQLSSPVLLVEGAVGDELHDELLGAIVIGGARTFEQDPRFGLVVLAEIASRALSPAVNDPGTAIDVVGTAVRLLSVWAERHWEAEPQVAYPHVLVPPLSAADLFDDIFRPIERDGAEVFEVGVSLQKAFADLACASAIGFSDAAQRHSERALRRADVAGMVKEELDELRDVAKFVSSAKPASRSNAARDR